MTFGLDHQVDGEHLKGPLKEIMESLQACILKDLSGSLGRLPGEAVWEQEHEASEAG